MFLLHGQLRPTPRRGPAGAAQPEVQAFLSEYPRAEAPGASIELAPAAPHGHDRLISLARTLAGSKLATWPVVAAAGIPRGGQVIGEHRRAENVIVEFESGQQCRQMAGEFVDGLVEQSVA